MWIVLGDPGGLIHRLLGWCAGVVQVGPCAPIRLGLAQARLLDRSTLLGMSSCLKIYFCQFLFCWMACIVQLDDDSASRAIEISWMMYRDPMWIVAAIRVSVHITSLHLYWWIQGAFMTWVSHSRLYMTFSSQVTTPCWLFESFRYFFNFHAGMFAQNVICARVLPCFCHSIHLWFCARILNWHPTIYIYIYYFY